MNKQLAIASLASPPVCLDSIVESDQENLREWKNANRFAFFSQEIITPEAQGRWFKNYQERPDDWMFVVRIEGQTIGCMGFRLIDLEADVYNVILGDPSLGRRGWMRQALRLMCSFVIERHTRVIGAKVLKGNPARDWYAKLGFRESVAHDAHVDLKLDLACFAPCRFKAKSLWSTR